MHVMLMADAIEERLCEPSDDVDSGKSFATGFSRRLDKCAGGWRFSDVQSMGCATGQAIDGQQRKHAAAIAGMSQITTGAKFRRETDHLVASRFGRLRRPD